MPRPGIFVEIDDVKGNDFQFKKGGALQLGGSAWAEVFTTMDGQPEPYVTVWGFLHTANGKSVESFAIRTNDKGRRRILMQSALGDAQGFWGLTVIRAGMADAITFPVVNEGGFSVE